MFLFYNIIAQKQPLGYIFRTLKVSLIQKNNDTTMLSFFNFIGIYQYLR